MAKKSVREIHSFVLRSGRVSENRKKMLEENRGGYCIEFSEGEPQQLDFEAIFGNSNPVTVEIGFGMGDSPLFYAEKYPERNLLGIEVHYPGVARMVSILNMMEPALTNLKMIRHDAVEVLEKGFAPNSIQAFHIFFPDPWPKKRHHKRRLIQKPLVELLISRLAPGGYICTATDWEEYGLEMHGIFESCKELVPLVEGGFCKRPEFRPVTRFEEKGLKKNHRIINLIYTKQE